MAYCKFCGKVIHEASQFCPYCGGQVHGFQENVARVEEPVVIQTITPPNAPRRPSSNLALAIFTTLCCCLPFGIVAIVYGIKVDKLYFEGKHEEALLASENARRWAVFAIIFGIIIYLISWVLSIAGFFDSLASADELY